MKLMTKKESQDDFDPKKEIALKNLQFPETFQLTNIITEKFKKKSKFCLLKRFFLHFG